MMRAAAAVVILWRLFAAVARSGWQITWRILRAPHGVAPGFVDYTFEPIGPAATTVLACLICLTPGTTAVEVDAAAGRMRLHLLDTAGSAAALQEIRLLFERPVRIMFAKEKL
jgi:multisubunit Na+/H+ antiporter MnhE subunit